jgi:spermidine/putrescine transport system permease protein
MLLPLVTPEIVIGVALFLVFTQVYTGVPRGFTTMLLGHVTFTVSFVVIIVRGRLISIGTQFEEAARDLGATGCRHCDWCCCRSSVRRSSRA